MFESLAYAQAAPAAGAAPSPLLSFMPLVLMFIVFYFLLIRPQQKKQKETHAMIEGLKKGDCVVTSGGLIGTVTSLQSDYLVLKLGDNDQTKVEVLKSAISGLRKKEA